MSRFAIVCILTESTTNTANQQLYGVVFLHLHPAPCAVGKPHASTRSQVSTHAVHKGSRTKGPTTTISVSKSCIPCQRRSATTSLERRHNYRKCSKSMPTEDAATQVTSEKKVCIVTLQRTLYSVIDELETLRRQNRTLHERQEESEELFEQFIEDMSQLWQSR